MKKTVFIICTIAFFALVLNSCKKEEQSIEEPTLELTNSTSSLTALYPGYEQLHYDFMVAPEDVTDGKITVKVTSDGDPIGFSFEVTTTASSYTEGKNRFLYQRATGIVYAANHTDADAKKIKVDPLGDDVVITIGNNVISNSLSFIGGETLKYTFWSTSSSATIFLYNYIYDGTENKQIEVWSTRDDQHVNIDGKWNDPSQYQGLPSFNNYSFDIDFNDGFSYPADTIVGVYPEGDTIYVKYNNKTYRQYYKSSSNGLMIEN